MEETRILEKRLATKEKKIKQLENEVAMKDQTISELKVKVDKFQVS